MISELEALEERIKEQDRTIQYLGDYIDKLVNQQDKIKGLIIDYDTGKKTGDMVVSYLRAYMR